MEKIFEIQDLVQELNNHRNAYYNKNNPTISDKDYDLLFDKLKALEEETGFILSNSPTQSVGYEVISKLRKRTHPTPLKSLDKTKSIDELNEWRKGQDIILMLKADGLTVELVYENGELIGGYTRGNGEEGEDISHNVKTFKDVPLQIPFKGKLRIVGEAIIHWNDFNKINSNLSDEEKYKTPRNLVSGSVRQLDSKVCSERKVYFYVFNILESFDENGINVLSDSKYDNFKTLSMGFWTVGHMKLNENISEIDIGRMKETAMLMDIPIDGLVVSYDSVSYSNTCPETSHHPTHSIAFKFEDEMEETVLRSIKWNTTRSGQVNPTAIFDTVILDNTEVSRASLFNLTFIEDMGLNTGSRIKVSKRNLIIPYIEENLDKNSGLLEIPDRCPSCGGQTTIKNTGTADFLFCTNSNCPAQLLDKFAHFCSRDAMNIEGMSEATIEKFINKGWLKTFDDIYKLEQYKDEIIKMDGFGKRSYEKLIEAIGKSQTTKLEKFIYALGIDGVGKGGSKRIAKHFEYDLQNLFDSTEDNYDYTQIEDIGEITHDAITQYFKNHENQNVVVELLNFVHFNDVVIEMKSDSIFSGKKVYCSGTFSNYKKEELKSLLEGLGAEFASGYAKSLDYLIMGSLKGSSKEDKAKKDGVKILGEYEFLNMI